MVYDLPLPASAPLSFAIPTELLLPDPLADECLTLLVVITSAISLFLLVINKIEYGKLIYF